MANAPAQAGQAPLTGPVLAIAAVALALGTFMQVLDTTIANVSIQTIAGNLGTSSDQGVWVITAVAVSNGPRDPIMLPKHTTKPVRSQMLGCHCSAHSMMIPMIESA